MLNSENKNLIAAYVVTIVIAVLLIIVLMNFNKWVAQEKAPTPVPLTPASRGIISQKELNLGLFKDDKFLSLGPMLSSEELKRLETEDRTVPPNPDGTPGVVTGTVKPPVVIKREVRHSNPFIPF